VRKESMKERDEMSMLEKDKESMKERANMEEKVKNQERAKKLDHELLKTEPMMKSEKEHG
jgi:hypothetical protein